MRLRFRVRVRVGVLSSKIRVRVKCNYINRGVHKVKVCVRDAARV